MQILNILRLGIKYDTQKYKKRMWRAMGKK